MYLGESNTLQYFDNIGHSLASLDQEGDEIHLSVWYRVCRILSECYFLDLPPWLEACPGNHGFMPIWSCLITEILTSQAKFLESSGCHIVINCVITLHTINVLVASAAFPSILHGHVINRMLKQSSSLSDISCWLYSLFRLWLVILMLGSRSFKNGSLRNKATNIEITG